MRGPKIVRNLQVEQGVGVKGLILVSPVFDFREFSGSSILQYVWSLPTMAAVAREKKGAGYPRRHGRRRKLCARRVHGRSAQGRGGCRGHDAPFRQVRGIDGDRPGVSRRLAGRFDAIEFRREFDRKDGKVTGRYDASVLGPRSLSGFELLSFQRSLRRNADRAADQRRGRPHHAQAQLAAGRLLPSAQRRGREGLGFRPRHQSPRIDFATARNRSRSTRN